jgi:phage tail sheath gpL-like
MAIVQTKSTTITNRDATPAVISDGRLERGNLRSSVGSVAVGAADSATSYYPLVAVPSNAMVRAVYVTAPAGMTLLAGNIGVFKNTVNAAGVTTGVPAAAGSDTIFAAAQTLATAQNRTDVTNANANAYPTDAREKPLWQAIGLAADPGGTFDIGVAVTAANTGVAGRVGLEVQYVDNGT